MNNGKKRRDYDREQCYFTGNVRIVFTIMQGGSNGALIFEEIAAIMSDKGLH